MPCNAQTPCPLAHLLIRNGSLQPEVSYAYVHQVHVSCAGKHLKEVQDLMEGMYELAGDASSLMDSLVEQKEAFAREACKAALEGATGMSSE